jgi:hypothetical protein
MIKSDFYRRLILSCILILTIFELIILLVPGDREGRTMLVDNLLKPQCSQYYPITLWLKSWHRYLMPGWLGSEFDQILVCKLSFFTAVKKNKIILILLSIWEARVARCIAIRITLSIYRHGIFFSFFLAHHLVSQHFHFPAFGQNRNLLLMHFLVNVCSVQWCINKII